MSQLDWIGLSESVTQETLDMRIDECRRYIDENLSDPSLKWQLGVSGGKDSTASYLLLHELGIEFTPMFCDTGNEHPDTIDHAMSIGSRTGGPEVTCLKKEYTDEDFAKRRVSLAKDWEKARPIRMGARKGEELPALPSDVIEQALDALRPTGNNFLDMMMIHGMVPQRRAQFCTEELKINPVRDTVQPWVDEGHDVVMCSGVRADESKKRAKYLRHELDRRYLSSGVDIVQFRPILDWTAAETFAMHRRHGIEPNPLYKKGMSRVGCLPCIFANQGELIEIKKRFPEQIDRIVEWEKAVAKVSRWAIENNGKSIAFGGPKKMGGATTMFYTTEEYIRWVGEKDKFDLEEEPASCQSSYGLCE